MAASMQLPTSAGVGKQTVCTSGSLPSSFLQRSLSERTFVVGSLGLHLKTSEQVRVGNGKRVAASASAGPERKGARIVHTEPLVSGDSRSKKKSVPKKTKVAAAAANGALAERQYTNAVAYGHAFESQSDSPSGYGHSFGHSQHGGGAAISQAISQGEMKRCVECRHPKPLVDFQKAGKGVRRTCRACVAVDLAARSGKDMFHLSLSAEQAWAKAKPCTKCGAIKELRDFAVNRKAKDGCQNRCRACNAVVEAESKTAPEDESAGGGWTALVQSSDGVLDFPEANEESYGPGFNVRYNDSLEVDTSKSTESFFDEAPAHVVEDPNPIESFQEEPAEEEAVTPFDTFKEDTLQEDVLNTFEDALVQAEVDTIQSFMPAHIEAEPMEERSLESFEASETVAALQVKLLRLDFDLANARATKAMFYDQVQYLERVMANLNDDNGKLTSALTDAKSSVSELEAHVDRLEGEGRNLRGKLLRLDFDLVHARATKAILGEKVDDLERAIAADSEATRIRDEKLRTALEEASSSNAALRSELEAAQTEGSTLRSKVLNFSLDLAHACAHKNILSGKVDDLERMIASDAEAAQKREEQVKVALEEAELAISELERVRAERSAYQTKALRSDFDLAHANYTKEILSEKVDDFEKAMEEMREEEKVMKAAFENAAAANAELEAQVEAMQKEASNLKTKVLRFSLDMAHTSTMKNLLGDRVDDLERAVAEYEEAALAREERLKTTMEEATSAIAEVERLKGERTNLRGKILRLDLDLAHAQAGKKILGSRVDDLEREIGNIRIEDDNLKTTLAEAITANADLEAEVLSVQAEGIALRDKVLRLSLDLAHHTAGKKILGDRVDDLERKIAIDAEVATAQDAKLRDSLETNYALEADVERLSTEGDMFKTKLLRREFDLSHTLALKKILDSRVEDLERTIAAHDDASANLRAALAEKAEVEAEVERLDSEKGALMSKVLMKDFDLTHGNHIKGLLSNRVEDLERVIEHHDNVSEQLEEARATNSELHSEIQGLKTESDSLHVKILRQDFDMTHTRWLKKIVDEQVKDLESVIAEHEDLGEKLRAANFSITELDSQVAHLAAERTRFQTQVLSKDFDLTHTRFMKKLLDDRVEDLERVIAIHEDVGQKLQVCQTDNAGLQTEIQRLDSERGALMSKVLMKDFDLTHAHALKGLLDGKVNDLERVIATHEDLGEKLKEVNQVNADLEAQVVRLDAEKGAAQTNALRKDFDLQHVHAMRSLMEGKVEDLEKVIAHHDDVDAKLKELLASESELELKVETLEEEKGAVQTKLLLQDFDLSHSRAMKALMEDRVEDLEGVIAAHDDLGALLKAERAANNELQAHVESLENKGANLQGKLLRKDFDLAHTVALKNILDDRVQSLERSVADLDELAQDRFEKLKIAMEEAATSNAELERLRAEGGAMQIKLLNYDFNLAHERAGKAILSSRVDDLERMVATYEEVAQIRDTKLSEALTLIEELEAEQERLEAERGDLRMKLLRQDFDLTHARATRALLDDRVQDLEAQGEKLTLALSEANASKAELEDKVVFLGKALAIVQKEERALRTTQAELRRQVFNLSVDNGALNRAKTARSALLKQKESLLKDTEQALARAQKEAAYLVRQLGAARAVQAQNGDQPSFDAGSFQDGGTFISNQLAQIVSLSVAVQREEDALAESEQAALAESQAADKAAKEKAAAASSDDDVAEKYKSDKSAASKTLRVAGASVLLSSMIGLYTLVAPNMPVPIRSAATQAALLELSAPAPVAETADASEYTETSEYLEASELGSEVEQASEVFGQLGDLSDVVVPVEDGEAEIVSEEGNEADPEEELERETNLREVDVVAKTKKEEGRETTPRTTSPQEDQDPDCSNTVC